MTRGATRCVSNDYPAALKLAVTNNAGLAVVLACVLYFQSSAGKDNRGVLEIEASFGQGRLPFGRIGGNPRQVIVATITLGYKSVSEGT